jgi:hypothetical protein
VVSSYGHSVYALASSLFLTILMHLSQKRF